MLTAASQHDKSPEDVLIDIDVPSDEHIADSQHDKSTKDVFIDLDNSVPSNEHTDSSHLDESLSSIDNDFLTDMFGDPITVPAGKSENEQLIYLN